MASPEGADYQALRQLEESLWRSATRFDSEYMDAILAPDFFEFGRSGRIYGRASCLAIPVQEINAEIPLPQFQVRFLNADTALVTYVSIVRYQDQDTVLANRSSHWSRTETGWILRFHQGTPRMDEP